MKSILKLYIKITVFICFSSSFAQGNNNLFQEANYLIDKTKAIISGKMYCEDLELAKIYLITYQTLYKRNPDSLKNKQAALDLINKSIQANCVTPIGGNGSFEAGKIIITSEGGSVNAKKVEIPALYLPTIYMDEADKLSYFALLPKNQQNTIISFEKDKAVIDAVQQLKSLKGSLIIEELHNHKFY